MVFNEPALLQCLETRRTANLNMFDVLKKLFTYTLLKTARSCHCRKKDDCLIKNNKESNI